MGKNNNTAKSNKSAKNETVVQRQMRLKAEAEAMKAKLQELENEQKEAASEAREAMGEAIRSLTEELGIDLGTLSATALAMAKNGGQIPETSIVKGERKRVVLTEENWKEVDTFLKTSDLPNVARCKAMEQKFGCSFQTIYNRFKSLGLTETRAAK